MTKKKEKGYILKKSNDRILVPEGTHEGILYSVVLLGQQKQNYKDEERISDRILMTFEFPDNVHVFDEAKGEEPMVSSIELNLSTHRKSKFTEYLRNLGIKDPDGFNLIDLLNRKCLVTIQHTESNGETYANISNITDVVKTGDPAEAYNPLVFFNIYDFTLEDLEKIPDWIRKKVQGAENWHELNLEATLDS